MKRGWIAFSIPLLFLLLFAACTGKPAQTEVNYNQAIGVTAENISSMYVGYRAPDGWEFNTKDSAQIKMALDFFQNQKFITREAPKENPKEVVANIPYYCIIFTLKNSGQDVRIDFNSDGNGTFITVITSEKFTETGKKFYTLPQSTPEKDKQLFASLKAKNGK